MILLLFLLQDVAVFTFLCSNQCLDQKKERKKNSRCVSSAARCSRPPLFLHVFHRGWGLFTSVFSSRERGGSLNPSDVKFSLPRIFKLRNLWNMEVCMCALQPLPLPCSEPCGRVQHFHFPSALSPTHSPCIHPHTHTHAQSCTVSYDSVHYSYRRSGVVMFRGTLVH